ncbi:hypothetical protein [Streptomyces cyslabdanicus]|uniref:hypothetical protein n=1 Tax=Streptomyces cyslabdanicus TaxID=1470456 RepID=UPI00404413AE
MPTNSAIITGAATLTAALIGLCSVLWVTASNQRQARREQRAERRYDRRKEAYLPFLAAARAFLPLTEPVFLDQERVTVARLTTPVTAADDDLVEVDTWAHFLGVQTFFAEPSDEWRERAPELLHGLIAAFDPVDMEGPAKVVNTAREIVEAACRLAAGPELFETEAAQEAAAGGDVAASELLRAEVDHYRRLCGEFREQAKVALDSPGTDQR